MSSSEQNKKEEAPNTPKVKSRLLDDTGKRLLREIRKKSGISTASTLLILRGSSRIFNALGRWGSKQI